MLWLFSWSILAALIGAFYLLLLKVSSSTVSVRRKSSKIDFTGPSLNWSVLCVTWNTADTLPTPSELDAILPPVDLARHDIVAVALQECPPAGWLAALTEHCGSSFTLVANESSRSCIHLAVFARSTHMEHLSNIQTGSESFGLPVFYRKGAAAVCFSMGARRLLFISAHFSAHEGHLYARNTDALALFGRLGVACDHADSCVPLRRRFDSAFLLGDLNYRLTLPRSSALALIGASSLASLRESDELCIELGRAHGCFQGWQEQAITFPPTYKFDSKTSAYDERRTPAWCDRVLSFGANGTAYGTRERGRSDHQPVFASFVV